MTLNEPLNPTDQNEVSQQPYSKADKEQLSKENDRFTKRSALITLLYMSIGPFSLIIQAVGEVLDMKMITKRFENDTNSHAIEILGFTGQISGILGYLGLYFGQALTTRISSLIASGERDMASHLVTDILYLTLLVSLIFSSIFIFIIPPFLRFLGTPEYMVTPALKYLTPTLVMLPFTNLSTIAMYYLQSIGSSILSGCVRFVTYAMQLAIFSPLFLFGAKVTTTFMKLGSIVSGVITAGLFLTLMYMNKFSLHLNLRHLIEKFCPEVKKGLLYALPLILSFFVFMIPPIIILQTMTSTDKSHSKEIGGVFAVFSNIATVNQAIPGAFGQSLISTGTHAWGANNARRVVRLFLWTMLLNGVLTFLVSLVVIPAKSVICRSFLNDPVEIQLAEKMVHVPFITSPLQGIGITVSMLMIVVGKPIFSFIPQVVQMIILCAGSKILAVKNKNDISKVMYVYNISDVVGFILYCCFLFVPIREIRRRINNPNENSSIEGAHKLLENV